MSLLVGVVEQPVHQAACVWRNNRDRGWEFGKEVVTGRKDWRCGWRERVSCRAHAQGAKTTGKRQVNEWVELDMDPDGPRRFGSAK